MGDHRASISIVFEIHGKKYEQEWWINYFHDESRGVDQRIAEWFTECWEDAYGRYRQQVDKYFAKQRAAEIEADERQELARLKAKYDQGEKATPSSA